MRYSSVAVACGLLVAGNASAAGISTSCNLNSDTVNRTQQAIAKPGYLQSYTEPVYGTKVTRITGDPGTAITTAAGNSLGTWGTILHQEYSTIQAWNSDQSLIYIETNSGGGTGGGVFLSGTTYKPVAMDTNRPTDSDVRWHPTNPNLMYYVAGNSFGTWNVLTGQVTVLQTFSGFSKFRFGHWRSNLSLDGTKIAIQGHRDSDGHEVSFAYNISTNTKYPDIDLTARYNADPSTNVATTRMSPKGNYLFVGHDDDYTAVLDLNGNLVSNFNGDFGRPTHGDLTVDQNGDEVVIGRGTSANGQKYGIIIKRRLRDGAITDLTTGGYGRHTSTRDSGVALPFAYVSNLDESASGYPLYANEITAAAVDGSKVFRLAFHHGNYVDYDSEAIPTASPDGLKVLFASNWGDSTGRPVQVYVIDLTANCGGSTADTTPPSVPSGLQATAVSSSQINITWNPSTDNVGVTGYTLFRNGVAIANVTTTAVANTGLSAGTTYNYSVLAYDAAGNKSAQTAPISATTQPAPTPTPTPTPTPAPSGNLVTNPGFESQLTGWTSWGNSTVVTSPVYAGSHALRVGKSHGGVYQDVTSKLVVGGSYTFSYYSALGSSSDATAEIGVEFFDANGKVIYDQHLGATTMSWSKKSFTFTYPSGVHSVLIYVYKNTGSSYIYADSLSLTKN